MGGAKRRSGKGGREKNKQIIQTKNNNEKTCTNDSCINHYINHKRELFVIIPINGGGEGGGGIRNINRITRNSHYQVIVGADPIKYANFASVSELCQIISTCITTKHRRI